MATQSLNDADLEAEIVALRVFCRSVGARLTGDDMVREPIAARLLGQAPKTLRNDRAKSGSRRWPFVKRGRAVMYRLRDLAKWLIENRDAL